MSKSKKMSNSGGWNVAANGMLEGPDGTQYSYDPRPHPFENTSHKRGNRLKVFLGAPRHQVMLHGTVADVIPCEDKRVGIRFVLSVGLTTVNGLVPYTITLPGTTLVWFADAVGDDVDLIAQENIARKVRHVRLAAERLEELGEDDGDRVLAASMDLLAGWLDRLRKDEGLRPSAVEIREALSDIYRGNSCTQGMQAVTEWLEGIVNP